jgi:hypothetical protein
MSAFDPKRTFGNFAIFAAIRRASSLVSSLAGLVRSNATKHSAEKIYTNVKIIRFRAATDFCMTSSAPFAHT